MESENAQMAIWYRSLLLSDHETFCDKRSSGIRKLEEPHLYKPRKLEEIIHFSLDDRLLIKLPITQVWYQEK